MSRLVHRAWIWLAAGVLVFAACGGDSGADDAGGSAEPSDVAMQGQAVANSAGCSACHGTDGRGGGVGPGWVGLAGSTVELEDGREVVADTAYIRRAIVDPMAEVRTGYTVAMPQVGLSTEEVDALVAYIEELR